MDCNDARLLLNFARPLNSELEESEAEALASHLANCPTCGAHRAEQRVDDHIGLAIRAVAVPAGLRGRILAQLATQRDSWYRRRFLIWGSSAAAAVLIGMVTWSLWKPHPAVPDLQALYDHANSLPATPAEVEDWFRQRKVAMKAPGQFNYALLAACDLAPLQGKQVPVLDFNYGSDWARVYVLNDRDFNLKALERESVRSGRYTVQWCADATDPHTAYVFVYTGGMLERFYNQNPPPVA
jgi:hypothetical protein